MTAVRHYESGMKFRYEKASGKVSVTFRGRIAVLADVFASEDVARTAAEAYCRRLGWKGKEKSNAQSQLAFRRTI
jgi:hypothetical protein